MHEGYAGFQENVAGETKQLTTLMVSGRQRGGGKSKFKAALMINREIAMNEASKSNSWVSTKNLNKEHLAYSNEERVGADTLLSFALLSLPGASGSPVGPPGQRLGYLI